MGKMAAEAWGKVLSRSNSPKRSSSLTPPLSPRRSSQIAPNTNPFTAIATTSQMVEEACEPTESTTDTMALLSSLAGKLEPLESSKKGEKDKKQVPAARS